MMITGYVKGQGLAISAPVVVSDTIDYLEARFVFMTRDWDGLEVWAHWGDGTAVYDFMLDADGMITADQHLNLTPGEWSVSLTGHLFESGAMRQRIATEPVSIQVRQSGVTGANPFPPLPATVEEQILARLDALEQSGGGGGTSADAVLYTPQELTQEEQETARGNIGAQIADFVVNFGQNDPYTADKTFAEVLAAYEAGATIIGRQYGKQYDMYSYSRGEGFGFITDNAVETYYDMLWLWYDESVSFSRNDKPYPVTSVNNKTGAVKLTAEDVGAIGTDQLPAAVETALAEAKESGEFDGPQGEPGDDYILTEADKTEIAEEAAGIVDESLAEIIGEPDAAVPAVPGYMALGMTGAAVGQAARIAAVDADGKPTSWEPVDMTSGSGEWELIEDITTTEDVASIIVRFEKNYDELLVYAYGYYIEGGSGYSYLKINNESQYTGASDGMIAESNSWFYNNNERILMCYIKKIGDGIISMFNNGATAAATGRASQSTAAMSVNPDFGADVNFELINLITTSSQYKAGFRFTIHGRTGA